MMQAAQAEATALTCLTWLVGDDDLRGVFMGATGLTEDDLRARLSDPDFLASVLDFLLMDDAWVIRCGDATGLPYTDIGEARMALPGGQQVNWT